MMDCGPKIEFIPELTFNLNKIGRLFSLSIDRGFDKLVEDDELAWNGSKTVRPSQGYSKRKEKEKVCSSRQTCIK